jgi:hypothetical protein
MGVVKVVCKENDMCRLSLVEWIEMQQMLNIKVAKAYDYGRDMVSKRRITMWKRLGLAEEEIKVLKIIRQKHLLYEKYLDVKADYENLKREFNVLRVWLSEDEIEEYEKQLKQLKKEVKLAYSSYRRRVEKINNYRRALQSTFESFRPLHPLPTVVVKSILRPVLKELDLYLLNEMFKTVKLMRKQYSLVIKSYIQTLELANDLILKKVAECIEGNNEDDNCDKQWKLKMKALQHVAMKFPEKFVDNIPLIYQIIDAKPNSEFVIRVLTL